MIDSDEFDHYLSDNDLDLESIDLLEQSINSRQQSAAPPPPVPQPRAVPPPLRPPARPPVVAQSRLPPATQKGAGSNVRPSASFLRPPKPPPRQNKPVVQPPPAPSSPARQSQAREEQTPPAKRRRVSLNEKGQEGYVDPNPFSAKSNRVNVIKEEEGGSGAMRRGGRDAGEEEYVEENMPEIRLREGQDGQTHGYDVEPKRGTTVLPKEMQGSRGGASVPRPIEGGKASGTKLVRRVTGNQSFTNVALQDGSGEGRGEWDPSEGPRQDSRGIVQSDHSKVASGDVPTGSNAMNETDRRELEELRKERAKLRAALETSEQQRLKISEDLLQRAGESSITKSRMQKAELAHALALKEEQRERAELLAKLQAKEQELHNEREITKTKAAFQQIEQNSMSMHSSARKSAHRSQVPGSSQRSVNRSTRGASVPAARDSRAREGESPSLGRSRNERSSSARPSQQPQAQMPTFAGFHNSFTDSPGRSTTRRPKAEPGKAKPGLSPTDERVEREGSMAPPPFPMTDGKIRKSALKSKEKERPVADRKGKGKDTTTTEEDESFFSEGHGGEVSFDRTVTEIGGQLSLVDEQDENELDEDDHQDWDWEWVEEEREWRGEILAAVFSHTTFASIDTSSALPAMGNASTQQARATLLSNSTAPSSRFFTFSASTSHLRGSHQTASVRSSFGMSRQNSLNSSTSASSAQADLSPSTAAVPTFHSLMNLRFPMNSPPTLVTAYETATRNLFLSLGRRLDPRLPLPSQNSLSYPSPADYDSTVSALHLCSNLSHSFQTLLTILDEAGLVGPITALLSLVNHLVYLFPLFSRSILEKSESLDDEAGPKPQNGLLSIVARMISRYGKPTPALSSTSAQGPDATEKRPLPFQNRRSRQAARISSSRAKKKGTGQDELDRTVIEDKGKREALVRELTAVVEGLAWRYASEGAEASRNGEEQLLEFIKSPLTISTLLDPNQPVDILLSSSRTLALLAARPRMYREILSIKIADSADVRHSPLPIFERIATLLNLQRDSVLLYDLHSALLVLSSSLLTHQPDSIRLIAESPRFIPEGLLKRIYRDVETIWEWDGRSVGRTGQVREMLRKTTQRLYTCVTLLYYLLLAPHSSLSLPTLFRNSEAFRSRESRSSSTSQLAYVQDWSYVALGTLAFTDGVPNWAEPEEEDSDLDSADRGKGGREAGEGEEAARLMDMKYLAQEILEEMLPDELNAVGECFGVLIEDEEGEDEDEGDA